MYMIYREENQHVNKLKSLCMYQSIGSCLSSRFYKGGTGLSGDTQKRQSEERIGIVDCL